MMLKLGSCLKNKTKWSGNKNNDLNLNYHPVKLKNNYKNAEGE
jgi:hypothetical protein